MVEVKHKLITASAVFVVLALALTSFPDTGLALGIPETEWDKTFGGPSADYGSSVKQTSDGGYIIAGGTESFGVANMDVWLIKTNSTGHEEWNVTFNSSGRDYGHSVEQTSDDGYIIAGYTGPRAGEFDVWLIKTDSSGNKLWDKTFGGAGDNRGHSVEQTSDGGYIITGRTGSHGLGKADVWLIKTDSNGNEQWNKTFGGSYDDYGNSVQQTSDGGYIIAGFAASSGDYPDVRLIKLKPISPEGENGAGGLPFWIWIAIGVGVVLIAGIVLGRRLARR